MGGIAINSLVVQWKNTQEEFCTKAPTNKLFLSWEVHKGVNLQ